MERVDIDRPSTWVRWREELCGTCHGGCCMMPVEVHFSDLERLGLAEETPKKTFQRLMKEGVVKTFRAATGLFQLEQQSDRSCIFLHPTKRNCTVYEKRPEVCRKFPREMGPRIGYCPSFGKRVSFSRNRSTSQAACSDSLDGKSSLGQRFTCTQISGLGPKKNR